jgi:K+-transporting ATPase ATPase A chain
MAGLTVQNFVSAAAGIAMALALTRAFARSGAKTVGNFWVDLTRATLYVLLPLATIVALAFVAMGLPQTLDVSVTATTLEGARQTIALGPVASQEAIKAAGPMAAAFSTSTRRIRSRMRPLCRTTSTSSLCSLCQRRSFTPSARW